MLSLAPVTAKGNYIQFQTNVGNFNVTLNPTNNPNLQPYVDNFLAYAFSGRYDNTVINRAQEGFVIQWGSFVADVTTTSELEFGFSSIERFDPVIVDADGNGQVDFDTSALNNTLGTVSFALSTGPNTAAGSIFVNLGDNSGLDSQGFVPFAVIEDLTVIDTISNLTNLDLRPQIGGGGLAYSDVPIIDPDEFVIVEQAIVVLEAVDLNYDGFVDNDDLDILLGNWNQATTPGLGELDGTSLVDGLDLGLLLGTWNPQPQQASSFTQSIPEPSSLLLFLSALLMTANSRRRS